jgi:hypothetical protein
LAVRCAQVADELQSLGLLRPELEILAPTHQSYRALLLQPAGPIFTDREPIVHWHGGDGGSRCKSFLSLAAVRGNQLVVVPEYCLPIETLIDCVTGEVFPDERAVWVLRCESLTPTALESFKEQTAAHCTVVHEPLKGPAVEGTYYDAVAYCFVTADLQGRRRRVVIFQFKTGPSCDPHFFENECPPSSPGGLRKASRPIACVAAALAAQAGKLLFPRSEPSSVRRPSRAFGLQWRRFDAGPLLRLNVATAFT